MTNLQKKKTQMADKHMKRISLLTKGMQIKTTVRCNLTHFRLPKILKSDIPRVNRQVEQQELFFTEFAYQLWTAV